MSSPLALVVFSPLVGLGSVMQMLDVEPGSQPIGGLSSRIGSRLPGLIRASPWDYGEYLPSPLGLWGVFWPFSRGSVLSVLHQV